MKMKMNIGGMKSFFVAHGEKVGLAVVGLVCLMLIFSAIKRERLDASKSPQRLSEASSAARQKIENSQWSTTDAQLEAVDFRARANRLNVVPQSYTLATEINPGIWPATKKRGVPKFYPIEDLRVSSGFGTFALSAEPGELMISSDSDTPTKPRPKPNSTAKAKEGAGGVSMFGPSGTPGKQPKGEAAPSARFGVGGAGPGGRPGGPPTGFSAGGTFGGGAGGASRRPMQMFQGRTPGFQATGNKLTPQRWVVITGLIPAKKQQAAFDEALEGTQGGDSSQTSERPNYADFKVERAVVTSDDQKEFEWETLDLDKLDEFAAEWAGNPNYDPAPPDARLDEYFTAPLGPLVGVDWDESVTHPKLANMPRSPLGAGGGAGGFGSGGRFGVGGGSGVRMKAAPNMAGPGGGFSGGGAFSAGGRPAGGKRKRGAQEAITYDSQREQIEYYLFRFFDFTVEPDAKYRYRVTLELENPNFQLQPKFLEKPESRKEEYVASVSDPTPSVAVAKRASRVIAGPAKASTSEPTASLVVSVTAPGHGFEISTSVDAQRGTLLNLSEKGFQALDPALAQAQEPQLIEFPGKTTKFLSDAVVLDIRGGEPLSKDKDKDEEFTEPSKILLVDSLGRLIVRDELDDFPLYVAFEQQKEEKEKLDEKSREPAATSGGAIGADGRPQRRTGTGRQNTRPSSSGF